ncbi:MAG TPA: type II toxin-antitoxin system prevent-host-death family antitoxin [Terriglobia bacterium]|jgi:prevent-host-death family protein|nr:type II toxin-antitoxin system prevent-host-death family antitoxin [Terriglobia bacterium]
MVEVGIKTLKDHLSEYLRRARQGERIVVTDRGAPIVVLAPVEESAEVQLAWEMVRSGAASWSGGKPKGSAAPPKVRGKMASEIVLEDRR